MDFLYRKDKTFWIHLLGNLSGEKIIIKVFHRRTRLIVKAGNNLDKAYSSNVLSLDLQWTGS